jgi:exosortase
MTRATRHALFASYWAAVTLINLRTMMAWFGYSRQDSSASHLPLIPLVTAVLIWLDRKPIFQELPRINTAGAVIAFLVAILSWFGWAYPGPLGADSLTWRVGAIVSLWVGGFLLMYGRQAARAAAFPLAFLVFMIPIPQVLLAGTVEVLKTGSAAVVAGLFTAAGTPFHREGFAFSLPQFDIVIADECSGIRSSIALVLTTLLAGDMFLTSTWTRAVLVLVSLPVAVLKNGIRIASLSWLALNVDPDFLTGQLHHEGGFVFFLMALVILGPVLYLLRRLETDNNIRRA